MNNQPSVNQSITVKTFGVMILTIMGKFTGFIRSAIYAAIFGLTAQTDVFFMATSINAVLSGVLDEGLRTPIVPLRAQLLQEKGKKEADHYISAVLEVAFLSCIPLILISIFCAPILVNICAPNFTGEQVTLAVMYVRILSVLYVFSATISVLSGVLYSHQRFFAVTLLSFPYNFFCIGIALLLGNRIGENAMLLGFILGVVSQSIFLIPACRKLFSFHFTLNLKHPVAIRSFSMSIPMFIGSYTLYINQAIDKALASGLRVGSVSALNYSNQLVGLVHVVITASVVTTVFSSLSRYATENNLEKVKALLLRAMTALSVILMPITSLCLLYHRELVSIVFQHGSFDEDAMILTSQVFLFYALSLFPLAIQLSVARCFHAQKDSKTPLIVSAISIAINLVLSLSLMKPLQAGGLALATSLAAVCNATLLLALLRKRLGPLGLKSWGVTLIKALIGLIVLLGVSITVKLLLPLPTIFNFALATLLGGGVYIGVLWVLKQQDIRAGLRFVLSFLRATPLLKKNLKQNSD